MMRTLFSTAVLFVALVLIGRAVQRSAQVGIVPESAKKASPQSPSERSAAKPTDRETSLFLELQDWSRNPPLFGLSEDGLARLLPPAGWHEAACPCCSGPEESIRQVEFEEPVTPGDAPADAPSDSGSSDNEPPQVDPIRTTEESAPSTFIPPSATPLESKAARRSDVAPPKITQDDAAFHIARRTKENETGGPPTAPDDEPENLDLPPQLIALREQVRDCLSHYYFRNENVASRSPWGMMHAFLPFGVDSQLIVGGRRTNAALWLCQNGVCRGQQLLFAKNGRLQTRIGVGVQGHAGQFLAMLAQSRVPRNYPLKVDGLDFTVNDLVEYEKRTCKAGTELTFKLIALSVYLKSDETWRNEQGELWSIPRLIQEELKQPIVGAACGGTHRLTGFSYAVRTREKRGEPVDGQWSRAKRFLAAYHDYVFRLQNPDGSFSTDWFKGRADTGVTSRRLETTGHMTEWVVYTLPEDQLKNPRVVQAVDYLSRMLLENRTEKWSIGPLGHGLHALALYDERVFGGKPGNRALELADHAQARKLR